MIGLLCSLAAWIPAWLIARRESSGHACIKVTFAVAAQWSFAVALGSAATWPRLTLIGMAGIPLCAAMSYSEQWDSGGNDPDAKIVASERRMRRLIVCCVLWACFAAFVALAPNPAVWWFYASWAPYVASVALGWTLLGRWGWARAKDHRHIRDYLRRDRWTLPPRLVWPWTISQRIAALMLFADTVGLGFVKLPGYSEAIGRASLILIALVQVGWLLTQRRKSEAE